MLNNVPHKHRALLFETLRDPFFSCCGAQQLTSLKTAVVQTTKRLNHQPPAMAIARYVNNHVHRAPAPKLRSCRLKLRSCYSKLRSYHSKLRSCFLGLAQTLALRWVMSAKVKSRPCLYHSLLAPASQTGTAVVACG